MVHQIVNNWVYITTRQHTHLRLDERHPEVRAPARTCVLLRHRLCVAGRRCAAGGLLVPLLSRTRLRMLVLVRRAHTVDADSGIIELHLSMSVGVCVLGLTRSIALCLCLSRHGRSDTDAVTRLSKRAHVHREPFPFT